MDIGGSSLHFLDLLITIDQNKLETSVYSKPTDAHLYLNADSCHPKSQIRGIAKGVALRLRRICSKDEDFKTKSDEYTSYLINCGHDKEHVLEKFNEVSNLRRDEAHTRRINSVGNHCVPSVKYNPRGPNIRQIIKKHRSIIENDERAKEILPTNFIRVSYKRNANYGHWRHRTHIRKELLMKV